MSYTTHRDNRAKCAPGTQSPQEWNGYLVQEAIFRSSGTVVERKKKTERKDVTSKGFKGFHEMTIGEHLAQKCRQYIYWFHQNAVCKYQGDEHKLISCYLSSDAFTWWGLSLFLDDLLVTWSAFLPSLVVGLSEPCSPLLLALILFGSAA